RVELTPDRELAYLTNQPERRGTGCRGQVQQMRGGQREAGLTQELLHEVRLQAFLEQRESGAGADVRSQRDSNPAPDVLAQREKTTAKGGVAGRAVRNACPGLGQVSQFGRRAV